MIRQLATKGIRLRTPRFVDEIKVYNEQSFQFQKFEFVITEASTIELESLKTGVSFSSVEVDVLGSVQDVPFVIYCSYKGRDVPDTLKNPKTERSGVIELNLHEVAMAFRNIQSGQYLEALRSFIEESTKGRNWIYHPRYKSAMERAEEEVESWLSQQLPTTGINKDAAYESEETIRKITASSVTSPMEARFKCVICQSEWHSNSRNCKFCKTHLYTIEIKN